MNSRLSSLTQRITAIKKEFSKREIESAVKLLEKEDSASPLLPYLSNNTSGKRRAKSRRTKKSIQDQRSKAVMRLEHLDPDKYRVLSEFDSLLREGSVLPTVNDIRRLGESLTKDFTTRSSRRDSQLPTTTPNPRPGRPSSPPRTWASRGRPPRSGAGP